MAGIDKAAIVFSIAIALVGVGIAVVGDSVDNSPVAKTTAPKVTAQPSETKTQTDPFGDLAAKVKAEAPKAAEEVKMKDTVKVEVKEEKPMVKESAGPTTHTVDIPVGTSVPGCEASNACYLPADIEINVGDTVEWVNIDTAAHTVTGGSPSDGPSGVFDSSLVMADASYAFTFNDAGSYDYFCMVHPWMVGSVTVN
ncbi:MAG: plastocyanin/azurin family copper-binding protein [Nitrosopumilus sp.]|nr:plastocyanin/azurin family copper-binding protein [Nitrosopumilus sp.]